MTQIVIALLALLVPAVQAHANTDIRDVFRQMPDSIVPYLKENNRLDFIDFIDSNMKAEVRNSLDGHSTMTSLAADSLTIQLNEATLMDIYILPLEKDIAVDSLTVNEAVCLVFTYGLQGQPQTQAVSYYTTSWKKLPDSLPLSKANRERISRRKVLTTAKFLQETLNK